MTNNLYGVKCPRCGRHDTYNDPVQGWIHSTCGWVGGKNIKTRWTDEYKHVVDTAEQPLPAATEQPLPIGTGTIVLHRVQGDIQARAEMGKKKYGTYLRAHNGRDPLLDTYQEALDTVMYLCQLQIEQDAKRQALADLIRAILDWIHQDGPVTYAGRALIKAFQDGRPLLDGREWNEYPEGLG